ncbi:MAG: uracil-DNA glycosylase [Acidobacteria bacterium]|nr:uracil-DNA glycosylase [Acidobacteriota bacterium]
MTSPVPPPPRTPLALLSDLLAAYRDLGVEYLRVPALRKNGEPTRLPGVPPPGSPVKAAPVPDLPAPPPESLPAPLPATLPPAAAAAPAEPGPDEAACRAERQAMMDALRAEIGDCTRCRLHGGRTHIVYGEGNLMADLLFVGEGPGANEDRTGRPFVGNAGQLLDRMIHAMTLRRDQVYIANVVKCRPPENRTPLPDEMAVCGAFLVRQAEILRPRVIVCLGGTAAKYLLDTTASVASLRGRVLRWRFADVVCTYHPSYLLQNPGAKKAAWEDLQKAMALLGLPR